MACREVIPVYILQLFFLSFCDSIQDDKICVEFLLKCCMKFSSSGRIFVVVQNRQRCAVSL